MLDETTEIQELSLEKVIETKLVQNNVTDQVLAALKEKYGNLRLTSLDDKETYLEIKQAAKDCAKVRNLAVKVCKEGREDALRVQKLWVSKEKEVVAEVLVVEKPLDEEISKFDAEVQRKADEERKRQEEAYINRQATLTRFGAKYEAGCFVLGEVSFESELVKGASDDVWEEAVVPKFREEYEKVEAERAAEEKRRAEEKAELERQQQELRQMQEQVRQQQAELQRQRDESDRIEKDRLAKEQAEKDRLNAELQRKRFDSMLPYASHGDSVNMGALFALDESHFNELLASKKAAFEVHKIEQDRLAEERRQKEIEAAKEVAIKAEQQRKALEEALKAEALAQATDKEKYADLIAKFAAIHLPEMRSGQYRKKVASIRQKIEEILSL